MRVFSLFRSGRWPLLLLLLWGQSLHAQAPGTSPADALRAAADAAFDRRQYPQAIETYQKFVQGYPNSEYAAEARFHFAYAQFLTGQNDPAAGELRRLLGLPTTPAEIAEQAALLLPQVLAQAAASLPGDWKTAAFEAAVKEYDTFIAKYPKSGELESALYGRAVANYQAGHYDAAARDLRQNLAGFPNSDTVQDSAFLLALTTATQANLSLAKENPAPADAADAARGYTEAERLLESIIAKRSDLSLVNDAQFQLGETLLAHAGAAPASSQVALWQRALTAYRAVEPKEGLLAAQQARLAPVNEARVAELRKGAAADRGRVRQLDQQRLREQGKLEALQAKEDPVLTARLKGAAVYCNLGRFDEARVLISALLPGVKKPEDEKLALYYTALSYAGQRNVDKAVAAYDRFQAKFAGDPLGENLPLVVSGLFNGGPKADPARASRYLDDLVKYYPNSRLRETALLQQAITAESLGQYDDALKTIDTFLAGKPKRELAATAELTRAQVLLGKGDQPGALAAFKKVRDTYAGLPEAEDAAFRVGATLLSKDPAGTAAELKAFAAKFPQSRLLPAALLTLGTAQAQAGAKADALATLADVCARFPDGPEATGAYFARANLYLGDKKLDDVVRTLTEFTDKKPGDAQASAAFEQMAAVLEQQGKTEAAAAACDQFLAKQPGSPQAADILGRQAGIWLRAARKLGSYSILGVPQREEWKADVGHAVTACERQLTLFPEAPATALGLQDLLDCQRLLLDAKVKTEPEVTAYFQALADKNKDKPAARARIGFRLASLTAERDPARALTDLRAAYDPAVVFSPADLDLYVGSLLAGDPSAAAPVLEKAARDYSLPPGLTPAQAPQAVQDAQALVLYGRARLAASAGNAPEAARLFGELKRDYPRSPHVPEANLGLAENLVAQGKPDAALPLLGDIAKAPRVPNDVRARGLLLNGDIQAARGSAEAADAYLKLAAFFPKSAQAPEGLWKGGQILEKQAATLGETPAAPGGATKSSQLARARKAYADLTARYPDSPFAEQAKARLAALPVNK